MAFIKKGTAVATTIGGLNTPAETQATIDQSITDNKTMAKVLSQSPVRSGGRDFDAEARGKTRCALEEAWAQSPLLPMLVKDPSNHEEVHAILDAFVTERMKRVFPNG